MTDTETITENTTSHLYTRRGWELENISSRVVGIVWVNYRKKWGWSGWKSRWIELHKDYLLFYKYSKRKRHYKQINIDFTRPDAIYKTGGMECDGEMFSFSVFKNLKKKFSIKSPSKTVVTLLYPLLDACLHHNTPTNDCPFPI